MKKIDMINELSRFNVLRSRSSWMNIPKDELKQMYDKAVKLGYINPNLKPNMVKVDVQQVSQWYCGCPKCEMELNFYDEPPEEGKELECGLCKTKFKVGQIRD